MLECSLTTWHPCNGYCHAVWSQCHRPATWHPWPPHQAVRDTNDRHTLPRHPCHNAVCSPLSPTLAPQCPPSSHTAPLGAAIAGSPRAVPSAPCQPSSVVGSQCPEPHCVSHMAGKLHLPLSMGQDNHHGGCMPGNARGTSTQQPQARAGQLTEHSQLSHRLSGHRKALSSSALTTTPQPHQGPGAGTGSQP